VKAHARPINLRPHKYTLRDVLLPDGMNLNQKLVKQGWCWLYRRDAPRGMGLERLGRKRARRGKACGLIRNRCPSGYA
jgi:endonuclease YncB( thermonuclease family)